MHVYDVPQAVVKVNHGPQNRIWICDVSGSMYWHIKGMTEDIIKQLDHCDPQDVLTILWFSSEGLRGTIVKGMRIGQDKAIIEALIRKEMYARNLTCFSESLWDAFNTINSLNVYALPWSIFFFSDGYPVVSNYNQEIKSLLGALQAIKPNISEVTLVGYGDYYNEKLLNQMAETVGGTLVHAGDLAEFSPALTQHIKSRSLPRIKIDVQSDELLFGVTDSGVQIFAAENGAVTVPQNLTHIYGIPNRTPTKNELTAPDDTLLYAAAYTYARAGQGETAVQVLAWLGDVYLVNKLISAFTVAEIGSALNEIQAAAIDENVRFKEGRSANCLPKRDAFCLIEALEILESDTEAKFYPDAGFEYKLTGVPTKVVAGFPEFYRLPNQAVPVKLTWHGSRLNVSLQVEYKGTVVLDNTIETFGYTNPFGVVQFRNYVIIKDGVLNVKVLPISMSRATFMAFKGGKLIKQNEEYVPGKIYLLELKRIPIMNRAMADNVTAQQVAQAALIELDLEAQIKVAKYFRNQLDPEKIFVESPFSQEFIAYLNLYGIDYRGWYAPQVEKVEAADHYEAKRFEVKIKGASSLPKVDEVVERAKAGKPLNRAQQAIWQAYEPYRLLGTRYGVQGLDEAIAEAKVKLANERKLINRARAAIVLGNRWFSDLGSRENNVVKDGDTEIRFEFSTEKVAY